MDEQQTPGTGGFPPPPSLQPPAAQPPSPLPPPPAADPSWASVAPAPVSLPTGPPSPWAPGAAGGQIPADWARADTTYVAAPAKARRPRRAVAVVAAVALVGGGLAATVGLMNRQQAVGAQPTPEAAVREFLDAVEDRDLLGAAATLAPAERALVTDLLADWRATGVRGVPSDDELTSLDTYTLELTDVTTVTQPVTDDIAVVELTGGTYSATSDVRQLPFGFGAIADRLIADGEVDEAVTTVTGDIADDEEPLRLATVRDDAGWHVSIMYSIAEAARFQAGMQAPDPAQRIPAAGASSPEDAVRGMVDAAATGDWRRIIELTSPTEMAVLHDYGHLLLEDAPPPPDEPWFTVTDLTFDRREARNATVLTVRSLAGSAVLGDRAASLVIEQVSPGCFRVAFELEGDAPVEQEGCSDDGFGQTANEELSPEMRERFAELKDLSENLGGLVMVEVDGSWYLSPARTVGQLMPVMALGLELAVAGFGEALGGSDSFDELEPMEPTDAFCISDDPADCETTD